MLVHTTFVVCSCCNCSGRLYPPVRNLLQHGQFNQDSPASRRGPGLWLGCHELHQVTASQHQVRSHGSWAAARGHALPACKGNPLEVSQNSEGFAASQRLDTM